MAEKSTFVKVDRNIMTWRWYQNANTFRVFLHLILMANIEDHDFEKITVHRGELVTSIPSLSRQLKISIKSVRTALDHLKETGEVACRNYPHYQVISIPEYDRYQAVSAGRSAGKGHANGRRRAGKGQQSKNKRMEEGKNEKNVCATHTPPDRAEVEIYAESLGIRTDIDAFLQYNAARGWKGIVDWRPLLQKWAGHDDNNAPPDADELDEFGRPIRKEFK